MTYFRKLLENKYRPTEKRGIHGDKGAIKNASPAERPALIAAFNAKYRSGGKQAPRAPSPAAQRAIDRSTKPLVPAPVEYRSPPQVPAPIGHNSQHYVVHHVDPDIVRSNPTVSDFQHHHDLAHQAMQNFPDRKKNPAEHETHLNNVVTHLRNAHAYAEALRNHGAEIAKRKFHSNKEAELQKHAADIDSFSNKTKIVTTKGRFGKPSEDQHVYANSDSDVERYKESKFAHHKAALQNRHHELQTDFMTRSSMLHNLHGHVIDKHIHDFKSAQRHIAKIPHAKHAGQIASAFGKKFGKSKIKLLYGQRTARTGISRALFGEGLKPAEIGTDELTARYAKATPGQIDKLKKLTKLALEAHLHEKKVRNTLGSQIAAPEKVAARGKRKIQKTKKSIV